MCPNLSKVGVNDSSVLFKEDEEFLPNLEHMSKIWITCSEINKLKILSDKYSQTMKTLNLTLNALTEEDLKTCIECICRFENLQSLTLEFYAMKVKEPIDNSLILIGQKCNKLLKLDLDIDYSVRITDQFFDIFTEFKAIKKLKIKMISYYCKVLSGSVECFKHCKQLYELDINYNGLREDFFTNIQLFIPTLKIPKNHNK